MTEKEAILPGPWDMMMSFPGVQHRKKLLKTGSLQSIGHAVQDIIF